jgi:hypothetical protein
VMSFGDISGYPIDSLYHTPRDISETLLVRMSELTFGSALKHHTLDTVLGQRNGLSNSP